MTQFALKPFGRNRHKTYDGVRVLAATKVYDCIKLKLLAINYIIICILCIDLYSFIFSLLKSLRALISGTQKILAKFLKS